MKSYVLDASALMTFFENRRGAGKVEDLLKVAADANQRMPMCVVNWGEVYYSVWRDRGEAMALLTLGEIARLPIEVVGVEMDLAKEAARFKAQHKLPYADAFAAALAHHRKAALVTSDRDFKLVGVSLEILWV